MYVMSERGLSTGLVCRCAPNAIFGLQSWNVTERQVLSRLVVMGVMTSELPTLLNTRYSADQSRVVVGMRGLQEQAGDDGQEVQR